MVNCRSLCRLKWPLFLAIFFFPLAAHAQADTIIIRPGGASVLLRGTQVPYFEDVTGKLAFDQIRKINSFNNSSSVPNLGISRSNFWIRLTIQNLTDKGTILVDVENPQLNFVRLHYPISDNENFYATRLSGNLQPLGNRKYQSQDNIFEVNIPPYSTRTLYLEVRSSGLVVVPIRIGTENVILQNLRLNDLIFGIYAGIILIMFFYNLFIYYSVKDKTYLYYIFYILCVGFVSFCMLGYGYRLLWNGWPTLTSLSTNLAGTMATISAVLWWRSIKTSSGICPTTGCRWSCSPIKTPLSGPTLE